MCVVVCCCCFLLLFCEFIFRFFRVLGDGIKYNRRNTLYTINKPTTLLWLLDFHLMTDSIMRAMFVCFQRNRQGQDKECHNHDTQTYHDWNIDDKLLLCFGVSLQPQIIIIICIKKKKNNNKKTQKKW